MWLYIRLFQKWLPESFRSWFICSFTYLFAYFSHPSQMATPLINGMLWNELHTTSWHGANGPSGSIRMPHIWLPATWVPMIGWHVTSSSTAGTHLPNYEVNTNRINCHSFIQMWCQGSSVFCSISSIFFSVSHLAMNSMMKVKHCHLKYICFYITFTASSKWKFKVIS